VPGAIAATWTLLDLRKLEAADVVAGGSVGGTVEKSGKNLNIPDIVVTGSPASVLPEWKQGPDSPAPAWAQVES